MNKIEFPRITYNGDEVSKLDLESWYLAQIEGDIQSKLNNITIPKNKKQKEVLDYIKTHLNKILKCPPRFAKILTDVVDQHYQGCFQRKPKHGKKASTQFGKSIMKAFNYSGYRKTVLLSLAQKLNVKSCPYCNMHYTLFAETDNKKKEKIAKLQFDHFYGKAEYPFLSMSLYNLIPSCAVCNQGKSSTKLSLEFHPYVHSIGDQFHFEVDNAILLYLGGKQDIIEIKIESDGPSPDKLKEYQEMFNIKSLYRRHKDIIQEVFDKQYLNRYYSKYCFPFVSSVDTDYFSRLWMGSYLDKKDLEKRPMSKFINDIQKQAKGIIGFTP